MIDEETEPTTTSYTCSDGIKMDISYDRESIIGTKRFTDYLNSRDDAPADYLNNGVLMGWQDFFLEARFRTLKGLDQIAEEVRTALFTQLEYDLILYGPEEED